MNLLNSECNGALPYCAFLWQSWLRSGSIIKFSSSPQNVLTLPLQNNGLGIWSAAWIGNSQQGMRGNTRTEVTVIISGLWHSAVLRDAWSLREPSIAVGHQSSFYKPHLIFGTLLKRNGFDQQIWHAQLLECPAAIPALMCWLSYAK